MQGAEVFVVIPVALVITYYILSYRSKWGRQFMQEYLEKAKIEAAVEKVGIPPLRLWLRNRKGDLWCMLRYPDGALRWARVRNHWGTRRVEFFD